MLLHILNDINKLNIILASGSPRRVEYLKQLGLVFTVNPSTFEENLDKSKYSNNVSDYAITTAQHKAEEVYQRVLNESCLNNSTETLPNIIISADSIVVCDGQILEKPKSLDHAKDMLTTLSGRSHQVITGVHIIMNNGKQILRQSFAETTNVEFDTLSPELIDAYVNTYKPLDKAGAYGIQEVSASSFIKSIQGCFYNVTGIPIHSVSFNLLHMFNKLFPKY